LDPASNIKYITATTGRNIANATELKSMGRVYDAENKRSRQIL
jgi:hypothetical protein